MGDHFLPTFSVRRFGYDPRLAAPRALLFVLVLAPATICARPFAPTDGSFSLLRSALRRSASDSLHLHRKWRHTSASTLIAESALIKRSLSKSSSKCPKRGLSLPFRTLNRLKSACGWPRAVRRNLVS